MLTTLNSMTFEGFLVPVLLMLAILVAPSATAFFLIGHFLKWGKSEAGALFAFGLVIDFVIRYGYGRQTLINIFKIFLPRPSAASPEKMKAAKVEVELGKLKKAAGEEAGIDALRGEVVAEATPE